MLRAQWKSSGEETWCLSSHHACPPAVLPQATVPPAPHVAVLHLGDLLAQDSDPAGLTCPPELACAASAPHPRHLRSCPKASTKAVTGGSSWEPSMHEAVPLHPRRAWCPVTTTHCQSWACWAGAGCPAGGWAGGSQAVPEPVHSACPRPWDSCTASEAGPRPRPAAPLCGGLSVSSAEQTPAPTWPWPARAEGDQTLASAPSLLGPAWPAAYWLWAPRLQRPPTSASRVAGGSRAG